MNKSENTKETIQNTLSQLHKTIDHLSSMEEEIFEREERFRIIAEFAYDWEYWQDDDGNYIYVSPSCEHITGYTSEEFYSEKGLLKQIIHPKDWDNWESHSHKKSKAGMVEPIAFRIITNEGEERWIHHVCRTVYGKNGESLGVRGSNRDITEQVKAQEELKTLKGLLPICASCKKIRDDEGYWTQLETYIKDHSQAEFTHSLCPECARKLYPEFYNKNSSKKEKPVFINSDI